MEQETSYGISKEDKPSTKQRVIRLMIRNFFIWFIPGLVILVISFVAIFILLAAAATGVEIDLYKRMPKGLVSFLGIAYLLSGIAFVILLFIIPEIDVEGVMYLVGATIICWILAYMGIKKEWQRLKLTVASTV